MAEADRIVVTPESGNQQHEAETGGAQKGERATGGSESRQQRRERRLLEEWSTMIYPSIGDQIVYNPVPPKGIESVERKEDSFGMNLARAYDIMLMGQDNTVSFHLATAVMATYQSRKSEKARPRNKAIEASRRGDFDTALLEVARGSGVSDKKLQHFILGGLVKSGRISSSLRRIIYHKGSLYKESGKLMGIAMGITYVLCDLPSAAAEYIYHSAPPYDRIQPLAYIVPALLLLSCLRSNKPRFFDAVVILLAISLWINKIKQDIPYILYGLHFGIDLTPVAKHHAISGVAHVAIMAIVSYILCNTARWLGFERFPVLGHNATRKSPHSYSPDGVVTENKTKFQEKPNQSQIV